MDEILNQLSTDPLGRLVSQHLVAGGLKSNYLFLLVSARLAGVLLVAPCFLAFTIPFTVRFGLVLFLSLVITPVLSRSTDDDLFVTQVSFNSDASRSFHGSLLNLGCEILNEIGLGTLLGIGTITVLSGLRLGGDWLDRQTGLNIGAIMNAGEQSESLPRSSLVELLGVAIFLTMKPLGGILLLLQSLLQSFQWLPVGSAAWMMSLKDVLAVLVQQSFVLGLRIAIPLIAAMTLIDVFLAFVNRDTPLPFGSFALIIRTSITLIILALTITTLPDVVTTTSMSVFQSLRGIR